MCTHAKYAPDTKLDLNLIPAKFQISNSGHQGESAAVYLYTRGYFQIVSTVLSRIALWPILLSRFLAARDLAPHQRLYVEVTHKPGLQTAELENKSLSEQLKFYRPM